VTQKLSYINDITFSSIKESRWPQPLSIYLIVYKVLITFSNCPTKR